MGAGALALTREVGLPADARLDDARLGDLIAGAGGAGAARLSLWRAATDGLRAPDPETELRLAEDILACMDQVPAERLLARRGSMLVRAASAVRAAATAAPASLRHAPREGDLTITGRRTDHAGFFALETLSLAHRRFDGGTMDAVRREVLVACDAVTVLPWDPLRDRVLLVEQLRAGPLARGDANPWQLEAVAGRIDADETPEQAARREAKEEAGLVLDRLIPVAAYYPTTGAVSEYIWSFVAPVDLPDGSAGVHGIADEAEDIRGHLIGFEQALALIASGEIANAPLILSLYWLAGRRAQLPAAGI
ncbi:NUDIX domain-containing protein [Rhodobacter sp. Har01]|uniref:NUDIX domain-containing protein n=1 Tax=Rhodobacter sp. Har01 TaxID=2883999 RepID=UPI001D0933E7|nr:NUDIX domain-containing protein [Rhodobacter sp. Har01]MCB6176677.1 NUDIX domain-containing protein [Rhodobacter sp. Har01]